MPSVHDPAGHRLLRTLVGEARDEGRAVVMATHDLADLRRLADRVLILRGGRTVFSGGRAELREKVDAREYVLRGGEPGLEDALRELARRRGAELEGPEIPVAVVEEVFFQDPPRVPAGEVPR